MENPADDNLFDLKLNGQGVSALQSTSKLIKWLFLVSILACLLLLGVSLMESVRFRGINIGRNGLAGYYTARIHPVISLFDVGLLFYQFFAFYRFGQISSKAIEEGDESQLNNSFRYLARFTRLAIGQMCLTVLVYSFAFYFLFRVITGVSR
jgi:hypothetical protein